MSFAFTRSSCRPLYLVTYCSIGYLCAHHLQSINVDVDVVDLRAQADASMPASNNNVSYTVYSNF